jgi:alpha-tubulin suppressor-like RCC1 family protein
MAHGMLADLPVPLTFHFPPHLLASVVVRGSSLWGESGRRARLAVLVTLTSGACTSGDSGAGLDRDTNDAGDVRDAQGDGSEDGAVAPLPDAALRDDAGSLVDAEASDASDASTGATADASQPSAAVFAVCVGYDHACAITQDGELWCWGANESGQLGLGDTEPRVEPTRVGADADWSQVACGREHSCGVRGSELFCWGSNLSGQLGLGSVAEKLSPTKVAFADARAVAAGAFHSCALNQAGELACFGLNGLGRLGDGTQTDRTTPTPVASNGVKFDAVTAGAAHTCAVRQDEQLMCWGANQSGQLGFESAEACPFFLGQLACSKAPGLAYPGLAFSQVSAGNDFSCGVSQGEALSCWGQGSSGMLGEAGSAGGVQRTDLAGSWSDVSSGALNACGVQSNGTLWCWGSNGNGQLGVPGIAASPSPVQTGSGVSFEAVRTGTFGSCAIDDEGGLWCWGLATFTQAKAPAWVRIAEEVGQ